MANILVASGDEILRDLLELALQRFEHLVRVAENGSEAVKIIIEDDFVDLALFDHAMENMSALDMLKELKKSFKTLPLIMVLASELSPDLIKDCAAAGARDFVKKPFIIPDLILRIEKLLKAANLN